MGIVINDANDLVRFARTVLWWNTGEKAVRVPRVHCKDGWEVSIQAGTIFYSVPRDDLTAEYEAFELGYPSEEDPILMDYAEDPANPTSTVYPFVPDEVVSMILYAHGGIESIVTP